MDLLTLVALVTVGILFLQLIRLAFSDGDLALMWAERFGNKPDVLAGQTVWIVGASDGIGEHLAYELVRAGCRLVLTARRENELNRVKQHCLELRSSATESDVLVLPMDVLNFSEHKKAFDKIVDTFNHLDVLVNNAGRTQRAVVLQTDFEIERQMMELNYFANVSLTKTVLPHMVERNSGQIVVTSSVAGKFGVPNSATYCASKHALQGWYDSLRSELGSKDVSVLLTCPGPVFSGIQKAGFTGKVGEAYGVGMNTAEKRMRTDRCSRLISVAMANKMLEVWIGLHPTLLMCYVTQYLPGIAKLIMMKMGKDAVDSLRHGQFPGGDKKST